MWIRVAKNGKDVHCAEPNSYTSVYGDSVEEFYFGETFDSAKHNKRHSKTTEYYFGEEGEFENLLEKDGFLTEMWNKLHALFDWGDCDYFDVEKTIQFKEWLVERLSREVPPRIRQIYEKMLSMAEIGIEHKTGICFDF